MEEADASLATGTKWRSAPALAAMSRRTALKGRIGTRLVRGMEEAGADKGVRGAAGLDRHRQFRTLVVHVAEGRCAGSLQGASGVAGPGSTPPAFAGVTEPRRSRTREAGLGLR